MEEKKFTAQDIKQEFEDYKKFAFKQNVLQLGIGLILISSFQKLVSGFSEFILMPIVNYFTKTTTDGWKNWKLSPVTGIDLEIGSFVGSILEFLVLTAFLYLIYRFVIKQLWPEINEKPS